MAKLYLCLLHTASVKAVAKLQPRQVTFLFHLVSQYSIPTTQYPILTMIFEQKEAFLEMELTDRLEHTLERPPIWGRMSFQQMVEHLSDSFKMANGTELYDLQIPEDRIPALQDFLLSDKPFRQNTKAPYLPEVPPPIRFTNKEDAIGELKMEIISFKDLFLQDKEKRVTHPIFGDLDYPQWVLLLYKHATHHLAQFGI